MKRIEFAVTLPGLCDECESRVLFKAYAPANWDSMTDAEKGGWASEIFFGELDWDWRES